MGYLEESAEYHRQRNQENSVLLQQANAIRLQKAGEISSKRQTILLQQEKENLAKKKNANSAYTLALELASSGNEEDKYLAKYIAKQYAW